MSSEQLKGQIRGLRQAGRNANDGISLVQVAEGGLQETSNMLIRLRELGVQGASDTIGDTERKFIDVEYQQLKSEMDRISQVTEYNGTKLLDGTGEKKEFQIGTGGDEFQDRIGFDPSSLNAGISSMGVEGVDVSGGLSGNYKHGPGADENGHDHSLFLHRSKNS